jgi:hypothetical protein
MDYLTLVLEDDASDLVTTETIENPSVAWNILMHEFGPAKEEALVKENPKMMIMKLARS